MIARYSHDNSDVKRLITLPGIGKFFARLMAAEIDGVERFTNPKKLAGYASLVPSTYSSGGKVWNGRIIKGGNKWLRWSFIEAVIPAIRCDEDTVYFGVICLAVTGSACLMPRCSMQRSKSQKRESTLGSPLRENCTAGFDWGASTKQQC